jgi:hypothetical protein
VEAGYFPNLATGRMGRGTRLPPQFGHSLFNMPSTQSWQKVHSKLQIMACSESGGKSRSQHSQLGLISNMFFDPFHWQMRQVALIYRGMANKS